MALSPTEATFLESLVAGYRMGTLDVNSRAKLAALLGKRDGLYGLQNGNDFIRCALRFPGCKGAVWSYDAHIDHKVPKARNGLTMSGNLQAACEPCNLAKGDGR
jgi:hypothetical protein